MSYKEVREQLELPFEQTRVVVPLDIAINDYKEEQQPQNIQNQPDIEQHINDTLPEQDNDPLPSTQQNIIEPDPEVLRRLTRMRKPAIPDDCGVFGRI